MDRATLLGVLPPYLNRYTLVKKNQDVYDIVKEVLEAHDIFKPDYDLIAAEFDGLTDAETARALFTFLKKNVPYEVEPEKMQTTKSPSALLEQELGDCKHYAGFIAGILDALNRRGRNIKFAYRFASYSMWDKQPGHVFVVMFIDGKEIWIDPVLKSFNERLQPSYQMDRQIKNTDMLARVSGVYDYTVFPIIQEEAIESGLPVEITDAIQLLRQYQILNEVGDVNDALLMDLSTKVSTEQFEKIAAARTLLHEASIGNIFGDIWHGVKSVTLSLPRNAYLSLVALNVFGLGSKLAKAIYQRDGVTLDEVNFKKLADKWTSLGGKRMNLKAAVDSGKKKKKILGQAIGAAQIPVWVATASAIIAALAPILNSILSSKQGQDYSNAGIVDYAAMNEYNMPTSGGGIMDFIKANPLIVGAAGFGIIYFASKKK